MIPDEILQKAKDKALHAEQYQLCVDNWVCPDCGEDLIFVANEEFCQVGGCPNCTETVERRTGLLGLGKKEKVVRQKEFTIWF